MFAVIRPTGSVKAAGVVAIVGSALVLIGIALAIVGILAISFSQTVPQAPGFTPSLRNLALGSLGFMACFAAFGIVTGVGVIRLKNWARISALVWSGLTAVMCGFGLALFAFMPLPTPPNSSAPASMTTFVRVTDGLFEAVPLGIAIWWLILFNRKEIAAQFVPADAGGPLDASGFPVGMTSTRPPLPLPITVLAVFLMLSSLSWLFVFFVRMPMVLFGREFHGPGGTTLLIASSLVSTAAGIGLLYRKSWSYSLTLGLQALWFLSGLVTLLSPKFPELMRDVMASFTFSTPPPPGFSIEQLRRMFAGGLIFPVLIVALLLYYRGRFLQASSSHKGENQL
jgi:hypothetical protein